MKVLFIGTGLTHYYNQTLNRLNTQPGVEIINLADSAGTGRVGASVFQTAKGTNFKIVYLKEVIIDRFSAYSYRSFVGLAGLIKDICPNIIVFSETYLNIFLHDKEIRETIKNNNIKIIMRDIPFRTDKYDVAKNKIVSGKSDRAYVPLFVKLFSRICDKLKLSDFKNICQKIVFSLALDKAYGKLISRRILLKQLETKKQILNLADAHGDYVEAARDIFESYGVPREKIFITYNSPDTDILFDIRSKIEQQPPILPKTGHRLVHLSRLIPWKRVDMIIESLKAIKSEFGDAELLIIGSGPCEKSLKELSRKLGIENSVKFLGPIYDQETIGQYLLSSDIYVLAGMGGLSINDAMTFGLPVICSVCDGTEKSLVFNGHNGLYFQENDTADLTEKIRHLFRDPKLMKEMGDNSTKIIREKINIHTVVKGYMDAFNYVLKK